MGNIERSDLNLKRKYQPAGRNCVPDVMVIEKIFYMLAS